MDRTAVPAGRAIDHIGTPFEGTMPPLVGRRREQASLREALTLTMGGRGRLLLLSGEAGIGKTSLARDLSHDAAALGCRVLNGSCYDLSHTPPYGPWLELFEECRHDPSLSAPPAAFIRGRPGAVTDQAALFAEVRQFLAGLTAKDPTLILLEDLHWADPASVDLLRHVGPHLRHWPVLLLVTYRVDDLNRRHPFAQQLPALVREAEALRLDLRGLDAGALRALVTARYRLAQPDEDRLVAYLEHHADGNPFFATEFLRALEEESILHQADGSWGLAALERVIMPAFLRQVIEGRVDRLGEAIRQPLTVAAVIGQEVPLALWSQVANLDEEALLTIVEPAVEASLLAAERDGVRVRFVHALTREALYESVLPPRRRLWHRLVAEALTAGTTPDPDAVAYHLQAAGDARAWEWLVRAADRAQRAYAWLTAAERLQAATDLLIPIPDQAQLRARLLYRLGKLYRFSDPVIAIDVQTEAERLATHLGDTVLAAEAAYGCGIALAYSDRFRAGLAAITAASDALVAMPPEATREVTPIAAWLADALPETAPSDVTGEATAAALLHTAGLHYRRSILPWMQASAGQPEAAIRLGERYVTVLAGAPGASGGIRSSVAFTYHGLGIAYAALGQPEAARQAFTHARVLFNEFDHHILVAFTLLGELHDVVLVYSAADPGRRRQVAAEAEAALSRAGGALRPGVSPRLARLSGLILDGRWNDALRLLRDLPVPGNAYLRREITSAEAVLAHHRGEPEIAWEQIQALFPEGPATEPGDIIHQEGLFLQRLAADLCLGAGDLTNARRWLDAHDRWLAWSGSVLGQADSSLAWARYHRSAGESADASARAADALAQASAPDQPLLRLAAHRLLGEFDAAMGDVESAEAHLLASRDLADVCETPFERALTHLAIAELRAAQGATTEAATLLDDVRQVCIPLEAAPTLARVDALASRLTRHRPGEAYPAGLTGREVQVLRLLAQRQTDKEIAETLFLAPRTVQSHVAHILNKLGVANRREAAMAVDRLGLH